MKQLLLILLFTATAIGCYSQKSKNTVVIPAHSHNDYEHKHPLFDALDYNFKSVEADIYSIGDSLYVAHDFNQIRPGRTLRTLYLEPLKNRVGQNKGSVYGNGEEILLLVDIKDDAMRTYRLLDKILAEYQSIVTVFKNGQKMTGAVTVIVSGNRPFEFMHSQKVRYAGYDGRMENLDSDISPNIMPMVSDNWGKYFKWNGTGQIGEEEKQELQRITKEAKDKGYLLRFWATPNSTHEQRITVWKELREAGVGIIGADNLAELHDFFLDEANTN